MANTKKYVSLDKLGLYDTKIKNKIAADDLATLNTAKAYADGLASNYDAAGAAATAQTNAVNTANSYTDAQIAALSAEGGAIKANVDAIANIKNGVTLDSFADVEAALAGKQAAGDYATKAEAQGYANAKDEAIATAKAAGDAAQETANANAEAISAINNTTTGILATAKGYTDEQVGNVQTAVDTLSTKVGVVPEGSTVMGIIENIQKNAYDDTQLSNAVETVSAKVDILVGSDSNKSVRAIAAEELAAQLVADGADESLNTLEEIAAWIQSHPNDAAAMNAAIAALQNKVVLGTYVDGEETKEYATVKAYVEAAIAALNIGDYASAADLATLANRVTTLETESAKHATKSELQGVSDTLTQYKDAHASDYTNEQIDAAIKVNTDAIAALDSIYATDAELATAIEEVEKSVANQDAAVLAEAQKAITGVQTALDTHTGVADIHVTATDKTKWNSALHATDIKIGNTNGTILVGETEVAVKGLGSAAYVATTAFDAAGSATTAETNAKSYADGLFGQFEECSEGDINALFTTVNA